MSALNKFINLVRGSFGGGVKVAEDGDGNLADILRYQRARQRGCVPSARIATFSANPANNDPFLIGVTSGKFLTTLVAATTYAQVKRGPTAADTLANFIAYVNNDTSNTDWVEATTAPTWKLLADAPTATSFRVRLADERGGVPVPGVAPSIPLTCTITAGASAWSVANLNATGKELSDQDFSDFTVTVTQAMVTAGHIYLEVPFALGAQGNVTWRVQGAGNDTKETNDTASWSVGTDATSIDFVLSVGYTSLTGIAVGDRVTFRVFK